MRTKVPIDIRINAISTANECFLMKLRNVLKRIRKYELINTNPRQYTIREASMYTTMKPHHKKGELKLINFVDERFESYSANFYTISFYLRCVQATHDLLVGLHIDLC